MAKDNQTKKKKKKANNPGMQSCQNQGQSDQKNGQCMRPQQ